MGSINSCYKKIFCSCFQNLDSENSPIYSYSKYVEEYSSEYESSEAILKTILSDCDGDSNEDEIYSVKL